jgi:xanthine dehydrogenase YagR molybdenum-binding subunit
MLAVMAEGTRSPPLRRWPTAIGCIPCRPPSDDFDPHASPLGARGIGELGAIGVAAAIANAVSHATGVCVRQLPIRPEHLLT